MSYKVELTYFKETGKYYSEGSYITEKEELFDIFREVRGLLKSRRLPGLSNGHGPYYTLVIVPGHPHEHPFLCMPQTLWEDK